MEAWVRHAWVNAVAVAVAWNRRKPEFVRRAGFVLLAVPAAHDKGAADDRFVALLPRVEAAVDERNFVKKAVNWALRQTGKRNARLTRTSHRLSAYRRETSSEEPQGAISSPQLA